MSHPVQNDRRKEEVAEALRDIRNREFVHAEERLHRLLHDEAVEVDGELDLGGPLEEAWLRYTSPSTPIVKSTGGRFYEVYHLYAYLMVERRRFKDALDMLERAQRRNPAALAPHAERVDILKRLHVTDGYHDACMACFDRAFSPSQIALAYRNFAWGLAERQQWLSAVACLFVSMQWEDHPRARQELMYIQLRSGLKVDRMQRTSVHELLRAAGIPLEPRSLWVEVAVDLARQARDSGSGAEAAAYFRAAYALQPTYWIAEELAAVA